MLSISTVHFSAVVIPQILIKYLLHASHNSLGHVGAMKLYHFLKRFYYFQGMRKKSTLLTYNKILHKPYRITYPLTY